MDRSATFHRAGAPTVHGTSSTAKSPQAISPCKTNEVDSDSDVDDIGPAELEPDATAAPASVPNPGLSFMMRSFPAYTLAMIVATVLAVIPVTSVVGIPMILSLVGLAVGGVGVGVYETRDRTPPDGANRV